jgi:hypothetical protein
VLKTGAEHLEQLRDGRVVYIGAERVDDVTSHPAFRNAARSIAAIYDMKRADPDLSFAEGKERYSAYFLRAKTRQDLEQRLKIHQAIARMSHGLLGRSPDHVSSFVTGMAMNPSVFGKYADNLVRYYEHMRRNDIYAAYAVVPPQAARNPEFYVKQNLPIPTLRVVADDQVAVDDVDLLPVVVHERLGGERARLDLQQPRAAAALRLLVEVRSEDLLVEAGRIAGRPLPAVLHVDLHEFEMLLRFHRGAPAS